MIELLPKAPGVYRIVDVKTNRFYIGSSVNLAKRWRQHRERLERGAHSNPILQAVWAADPARLRVSAVTVMPHAGKAELLEAEQAQLDAAKVGINRQCMNVLPVAGSHLGRKRSDETRARLAAANRGKSPSAEARGKMRAAKAGKPLSEAHRRKLGDAARGKKINRPKGIYIYATRKLTPGQVLDLRARRAAGMSWRALTEVAGIKSVMAVRRAVLGITYGDVK